MHKIKHQPIANSQPAVVADVVNAGRGGKTVAFEAVVEHGEAVIITFNKEPDHWRNPSEKRDQRKQQNGKHVYRLPHRIAQGHPNATPDVCQQLRKGERKIFSFYDARCFFAEVRKDRRANNEKQKFEKREVKEKKNEPQNNGRHHKQEIEEFISLVLQPGRYTQSVADDVYRFVRRINEEVNADDKKNSIDDSRN